MTPRQNAITRKVERDHRPIVIRLKAVHIPGCECGTTPLCEPRDRKEHKS